MPNAKSPPLPPPQIQSSLRLPNKPRNPETSKLQSPPDLETPQAPSLAVSSGSETSATKYLCGGGGFSDHHSLRNLRQNNSKMKVWRCLKMFEGNMKYNEVPVSLCFD